MNNLICLLEKSFGTLPSCQESITEVNTSFEVTASQLPDINKLNQILACVYENDEAILQLSSITDKRCKCSSRAIWDDEYKAFIEGNEPNDSITIDLQLKKSDDKLHIYNFERYWQQLRQKNVMDLLKYFSMLLKDRNNVNFILLDDYCHFHTQYISFGNENINIDFTRAEKVKRYEDASLFMNRSEIRLIPEDFRLLSTNVPNEISEVFQKLECTLSLLYTVNSSYVHDDHVVVHIRPEMSMECSLNEVYYSKNLCILCNWIFCNDNAMEHAGIARNILCLHCKSIQDVLSIGDDVLDSIKSNYVIYQRNTTEQYIETKNRIADNMMELVKQQQELIKDIVDGLRNNFVAIVTFIITVVLSGLDVEDLMKNVLPRNVQFVAVIFIVASFAYFLACTIGTGYKMKTITDGHKKLKEHYEDVLDAKDLERSFDSIYDNTMRRINKYRILIGIVWVFFILFMVLCLFFFSKPSLIIHTNDTFPHTIS